MPQTLSDADLLARLVAFDTTSHLSNRPMADFLADYLDRPGVRVRPYGPAGGDKVGLVVFVGPEVGAERRGLVLSGHMDVVPAGEGWSYEPFHLTDGGERWFGRGTADMKGFVALAVNAAVGASGEDLAAPLVLALTYDEEVGCVGARHLAETWPREREPLPTNALIGEPTSLKAVRLHKGHMKMRVTLTGTSAHSGYPHLGTSAIEPAGAVITALAGLRDELSRERPPHHHYFPDTPYVALNIGRIEGGSAINVVPDRCTLELGLRLLPGMEAGPTIGRVERAVQAAAPEGRCEVEVTGEAPPLILTDSAPIYQEVCALTGQRETVSASYCTDAGWLQALGLDCLVCGPGTIEVAHKPDESLPKADLEAGGRLLESLIQRFCREGGPDA